MRPSNAGRNRRGITLTKADKIRTNRAKKQYVPGNRPSLRTTRWGAN